MTERRAHKAAVRQAFDRAATAYDAAAAVQRSACEALAALAADWPPQRAVGRVLDAGCGTGQGLALLGGLHPGATVVALDFAPGMLRQLKTARLGSGGAGSTVWPVCADLEALPLAPASVDAAWSSLALQWCDPALALRGLAAALASGGVAWIATLGPRTLWELRTAFAAVDDAEHVLGFHDAGAWTAAAEAAGLTALECRVEHIAALAPDLRSLLRDIKAIGAHTVAGDRRRKPMGKAAWQRLEAAYEPHRRADGMLPASYDLILIAVKKP